MIELSGMSPEQIKLVYDHLVESGLFKTEKGKRTEWRTVTRGGKTFKQRFKVGQKDVDKEEPKKGEPKAKFTLEIMRPVMGKYYDQYVKDYEIAKEFDYIHGTTSGINVKDMNPNDSPRSANWINSIANWTDISDAGIKTIYSDANAKIAAGEDTYYGEQATRTRAQSQAIFEKLYGDQLDENGKITVYRSAKRLQEQIPDGKHGSIKIRDMDSWSTEKGEAEEFIKAGKGLFSTKIGVEDVVWISNVNNQAWKYDESELWLDGKEYDLENITSTSQIKPVNKFEIPDELLEQAGIDPKKMSPEQLNAMFAELSKKGLLKSKPDDKKSTDKKPPEKQSEGASGAGRPGLVKKKVTVHRGGKTFEQERWVKAGEEEPVEKPKKVEEKPPEKPKGPVITGLNKPEDEVEEPEPEEPEEEKVEPTTKMTKENVDSVKSFSEMNIAGGINQDDSNIVKFKDGSKGMYKVIDKISDQGEANVAELQSILGWDNAPETVIGDFGKGGGSCQKWVENTVSITNADPWSSGKIVKLEEKHYDDLSKIYLMDLITGNFDRHNGNIKLDEDDKVWAIDNDTWGSKSDYGTVIDEDFSMSTHHFWMGIDPKDGDQKAKFQTYITKNAEHIVKNKEVITKFIKDLAKRSGEFNTLYKERTKKREEDEEIDYFIPKTHKEATGNMLDNLNKVIEHKSEYKSWWSEE